VELISECVSTWILVFVLAYFCALADLAEVERVHASRTTVQVVEVVVQEALVPEVHLSSVSPRRIRSLTRMAEGQGRRITLANGRC